MDPRLHLQLQLLEPEPFACSCLALGRARWSWSCCGNCAAGCVLLHPHPSAPPRLRLQRARWRMQLLLQRRQQQRQRHGLFAQIPSVHAHATANAAPSPSAAWQARRLQPSASLTRKRKGRAGLQPLRRAAPPPSPSYCEGLSFSEVLSETRRAGHAGRNWSTDSVHRSEYGAGGNTSMLSTLFRAPDWDIGHRPFPAKGQIWSQRRGQARPITTERQNAIPTQT